MSGSGRALNVIINHWQPTFTQLYGHVFPENYLCIDLEYTGFNADKELIWEIGHVLVENRQVVDQLGLVLDWTQHHVVPAHWARQAMNRVNKRMQDAHKPCHLTWELMQQGTKPEIVLQFYYDLLASAKRRNLPLVLHNGYGADERFLKSHFEGFLTKEFDFGDNWVFDTGAIEKASQAILQGVADQPGKAPWWLPRPGDTMRQYFTRVCNYPAKGVFWRLEQTVERYGLLDKYNLDITQAHRAEFDAIVLHRLMEEYRSHITVSHAKEDMTASPEAFARGFEQELAKAREQKQAPAKAAAQEALQQARQAMAPPGFKRRRRGQRPL